MVKTEIIKLSLVAHNIRPETFGTEDEPNIVVTLQGAMHHVRDHWAKGNPPAEVTITAPQSWFKKHVGMDPNVQYVMTLELEESDERHQAKQSIIERMKMLLESDLPLDAKSLVGLDKILDQVIKANTKRTRSV